MPTPVTPANQIDIVDAWFKFASDCDSSPGYFKCVRADEEQARLKERWAQECPGLECPEVVVDEDTGLHKLVGLSVTKDASRRVPGSRP